MIDDDAEYEQRRQIRAQADADVAAFIESLGQDEGSGVPPPPTIKVSEVSSQPVELDFIGFGDQGSGTAPGAGSGGGTPSPTGICCVEHDCSVTTEAECGDGIWVEGFTCDEVQCCNPYLEVHVEVVTCGTEGSDSCVQTIDLTARVQVPSVVASGGCCTDNLNGTNGAVDENGNSITLEVTNLGGGSLSWFVNVTPNCPTSYGTASMGGVETGDCLTGGTHVYPVNVSLGSGNCDGNRETAVGTITVSWHG
jgi:hypothetical protein